MVKWIGWAALWFVLIEMVVLRFFEHDRSFWFSIAVALPIVFVLTELTGAIAQMRRRNHNRPWPR
jgi:hypothetical protein